MKTRVSLLVLAAAFAGTGAALAQVRQGTVEINPFAGYLFGGTFARGSNALFPDAVDVDDHATYGGRLGVNMTSLFEIEFHYSRTETAFVSREHHGLFDDGRQGLGDLNIDYYLGYLTFNFGHRRVVPYFTMGVGAAHLDPRVPGSPANADTRFTASLGGGLKVFVTPHFGFRFDGRGYATSLENSSRHVSCNDFFDSCSNRDWLTNGEATGGLVIAF